LIFEPGLALGCENRPNNRQAGSETAVYDGVGFSQERAKNARGVASVLLSLLRQIVVSD
jgi:hypothetical protein